LSLSSFKEVLCFQLTLLKVIFRLDLAFPAFKMMSFLLVSL
jgi:hypothetical protein